MRIDCGIVQDLIPTYVDELCSEASKACVEEHIAECTECRNFVEHCRTVELSTKKMDEKQLDGMRKIKKKLKLQSLMSYGLLLMVVLFGAHRFTTNFWEIGVRWYYGLFAVVLVATFLVTMKGKTKTGYKKIEKGMAVASALAIGYALFWYCFVMTAVGNGRLPFFMERSEVGPFLHLQTGIAFAVEVAAFGYAMVCYIRKDEVFRGILLVSLTGIFFILAQTALLGTLSEMESYRHCFTEIAVVIFGIAAVGSLAFGMITKWRN